MSSIAAMGYYLPERVVDNVQLSSFNRPPDAILKATGIKERRIVDARTTKALMAQNAVNSLLVRYPNQNTQSIELIITVTSTPFDTKEETLSAGIRRMLQIQECGEINLYSLDGGFSQALSIAEAYIEYGQCDKVLIVAVDIHSHSPSCKGKNTLEVYGDGAAAILLGYAFDYADGIKKIQVRNRNLDVFVDRDTTLEAVKSTLEKLNIDLKRDVDVIVSYFPTKNLEVELLATLGFPKEKVISFQDVYGNLGVASCGVALNLSSIMGTIRKDSKVLLLEVDPQLHCCAIYLKIN